MKNDIIKKSKQIAIPNNTQRKKVDKIANQVFSLVNKEAKKQKAVVSVHFGGSYAKKPGPQKKLILTFLLSLKKPLQRKILKKLVKKLDLILLKNSNHT